MQLSGRFLPWLQFGSTVETLTPMVFTIQGVKRGRGQPDAMAASSTAASEPASKQIKVAEQQAGTALQS